MKLHFPRGIDWLIVAPVLAIAAVFAASAVYGLLKPRPAPRPATPVVREITPRQYTDLELQLLRDIKLVTEERNGLLGAKDALERRIRGLEARAPREILVVEGPKLPIDTAVIQGEVNLRSGLMDLYAGVDPDSTGYARRIANDIDVRGCDRILFRGLETICDRPRFGHAYLIVRAGLATKVPTSLAPPDTAAAIAQLGVRWVPYDGSPWAVETAVDHRGRWETTVARSLRLW